MKKAITLIVFCITGIALGQQAEITNGFDGFESWVSAEAGELPEYWDGFNKDILFNGMSVGSVVCVEKDSSDAYEGAYSVKITSTSIMGGPAVPGILTAGNFVVDWNAQDGNIEGGEAYTQLPTVLNGQFKYTPVGIDTGFVSVWFMQNGVEVGRGRFEFDYTASDWTEFNVAIDYDAGAAPDSMNIMFSSTNGESIVVEGSTLEIDAINFQSYLSLEELKKTGVRCYPNPANDHVSILFNEEVSGKVEIVNMTGVTVEAMEVDSDALTLDNLCLASGVYQLLVKTDNSIVSEILVIE